MHEMVIDSIRVSMQNYQRVVILRAKGSDSYLPIWIGPNEADSIALKLQEVSVPRPLTHDLLGTVIDNLGASVDHIVVSDLSDDTFYAKIVLDHNGAKLELDSRPSDAIALAVRSESPIYAEESVLKKGRRPDGHGDGQVRSQGPPAGRGEDAAAGDCRRLGANVGLPVHRERTGLPGGHGRGRPPAGAYHVARRAHAQQQIEQGAAGRGPFAFGVGGGSCAGDGTSHPNLPPARGKGFLGFGLVSARRATQGLPLQLGMSAPVSPERGLGYPYAVGLDD